MISFGTCGLLLNHAVIGINESEFVELESSCSGCHTLPEKPLGFPRTQHLGSGMCYLFSLSLGYFTMGTETSSCWNKASKTPC